MLLDFPEIWLFASKKIRKNLKNKIKLKKDYQNEKLVGRRREENNSI